MLSIFKCLFVFFIIYLFIIRMWSIIFMLIKINNILIKVRICLNFFYKHMYTEVEKNIEIGF